MERRSTAKTHTEDVVTRAVLRDSIAQQEGQTITEAVDRRVQLSFSNAVLNQQVKEVSTNAATELMQNRTYVAKLGDQLLTNQDVLTALHTTISDYVQAATKKAIAAGIDSYLADHVRRTQEAHHMYIDDRVDDRLHVKMTETRHEIDQQLDNLRIKVGKAAQDENPEAALLQQQLDELSRQLATIANKTKSKPTTNIPKPQPETQDDNPDNDPYDYSSSSSSSFSSDSSEDETDQEETETPRAARNVR